MSLRNAETSTKTEAMQSWFINSAPTSRIEHPLPPTGRRRRVAGAGWCSASPGSGDSHTADRLERFTRDGYGFGHLTLELSSLSHSLGSSTCDVRQSFIDFLFAKYMFCFSAKPILSVRTSDRKASLPSANVSKRSFPGCPFR